MSLNAIRCSIRIQDLALVASIRFQSTLLNKCRERTKLTPSYQSQRQRRHFFLHWLNSVFNQVSRDRIEEVGPDRACAEWLLRNGASVLWQGTNEYVKDYNELPLKGNEKGQFFIRAVNATDASIMAMGFPHFKGCNFIEKVVLKNCKYLGDDSLPLLAVLNNSLKHLEIINCWNVSSVGIRSLSDLSNLQILKLAGIDESKEKVGVMQHLKKSLPNCKIILDNNEL